MLYPTILEEANTGYKVFCGWGTPDAKSTASFVPAVLNIDKEGNLVELNIPYDITKSNEKELSFFQIQSYTTHWPSLPINNKFYHPFINPQIKVNETLSYIRDHLIIVCFDSLGQVVWGKELDTAAFGDRILLEDSKITRDRKILLVLRKIFGNSLPIIQILEIDTNGIISKNVVFSLEDAGFQTTIFQVNAIQKSKDESYIVLAKIFFDVYSSYYLLKINPDGEVLKINKFRIPNKNLGLRLNFLERSPNGFLYIFGTTLIDASENPIGSYGYKNKVYICRIDEDFHNFEDF